MGFDVLCLLLRALIADILVRMTDRATSFILDGWIGPARLLAAWWFGGNEKGRVLEVPAFLKGGREEMVI